MKRILSLGAGVQSSTLLLMSCRGELPKLDAAIFADTQWEPKAVYAWLDYLKTEAAKVNIPIIVATAGNIRQDILDFWSLRRSADGKRRASIPAFVKNPDGSRGLMRRQCTTIYKIEVIERVIREQILGLRKGQRWPTSLVIEQWIGISYDEANRRRTSMRPAIRFRYPLIDDLHQRDGLYDRGWTRDNCLEWFAVRQLPTPPRSACIGCPFHSDAEWVEMKLNRPDEWDDAVEVDRLIREHDRATDRDIKGEIYLHDSLVPLPMVELDGEKDASEGRGMSNDCSGMCGV